MQRSHFQAVLLSGRPQEQPNSFFLFPSEWQLPTAQDNTRVYAFI